MATTSLKSGKILVIQVLTSLLAISLLSACGGSKSAEVGTRRNGNGQPKPTPKPVDPDTKSGYHGARLVGLGAISTQQSARLMDLAINREKSTYLHRCQKVMPPAVAGNHVELTISNTGCESMGVRGTEVIGVDYKNANLVPTEIIKVSKADIEPTVIAISNSNRIVTLKEIVKIESTDGYFNVDYTGDIVVHITPKAGSAVTSHFSTISLKGVYSPAVNGKSGAWRIGEISSRTVLNGVNTTIGFDLKSLPKTDDGTFMPAVCGMPIGAFNTKQDHRVGSAPKKPYDFDSTIVGTPKNDSALIKINGTTKNFSTATCGQGVRDLEYNLRMIDAGIFRPDGLRSLDPKSKPGLLGPTQVGPKPVTPTILKPNSPTSTQNQPKLTPEGRQRQSSGSRTSTPITVLE